MKRIDEMTGEEMRAELIADINEADDDDLEFLARYAMILIRLREECAEATMIHNKMQSAIESGKATRDEINAYMSAIEAALDEYEQNARG